MATYMAGKTPFEASLSSVAHACLLVATGLDAKLLVVISQKERWLESFRTYRIRLIERAFFVEIAIVYGKNKKIAQICHTNTHCK